MPHTTSLKLIFAGVALGALGCSTFAPDPASHVCGTVALIAAGFAVAFRQLEPR